MTDNVTETVEFSQCNQDRADKTLAKLLTKLAVFEDEVGRRSELYIPMDGLPKSVTAFFTWEVKLYGEINRSSWYKYADDVEDLASGGIKAKSNQVRLDIVFNNVKNPKALPTEIQKLKDQIDSLELYQANLVDENYKIRKALKKANATIERLERENSKHRKSSSNNVICIT